MEKMIEPKCEIRVDENGIACIVLPLGTLEVPGQYIFCDIQEIKIQEFMPSILDELAEVFIDKKIVPVTKFIVDENGNIKRIEEE